MKLGGGGGGGRDGGKMAALSRVAGSDERQGDLHDDRRKGGVSRGGEFEDSFKGPGGGKEVGTFPKKILSLVGGRRASGPLRLPYLWIGGGKGGGE